MAKTIWIASIVGLGFFALVTLNFVWQDAISLFLLIFLFVPPAALSLIFALWGFREWRKFSRLWLIPSLIYLVSGLAAFFFAPLIGTSISDRIFERHMIEYSKVVETIRSGAISCRASCDAEFGFIDMSNNPTHIIALLGARCDDGGVSVLFLSHAGFLLHHEGYLFRDYGAKSSCSTGKVSQELDRYYLRHIVGPWYRFSD